MADTIPNLWSDDISTDVLSPLAILRTQAGMLRQITKGLVQAEVVTESVTNANAEKPEIVQHHLDLIASALDRSRYRIVSISHQKEMVYPVKIEAEFYSYDGISDPEDWDWPEAHDEETFIHILGLVLRSDIVKSTLHSLIARSNEERGFSGISPETEEAAPSPRKGRRRPPPPSG